MNNIINKFLDRGTLVTGQTTIVTHKGITYLYHRDAHTGINEEVARLDERDHIHTAETQSKYATELKRQANETKLKRILSK